MCTVCAWLCLVNIVVREGRSGGGGVRCECGGAGAGVYRRWGCVGVGVVCRGGAGCARV